MQSSFYLGIHQLRDALLVMQNPGVYWQNVGDVERARLFCRQTVNRQTPEASVVFIAAGDDPADIIGKEDSTRLKNLSLYALPPQRQAVLNLAEDAMRAMKARNLLLVLYMPGELWKSLTVSEFSDWLKKMNEWTARRHITLLIFNHGASVNTLRGHLVARHRELCGLANLIGGVNGLSYEVDFWCNNFGVSARQKLPVSINEVQELNAEEELNPESRFASDEDLYMTVTSLFPDIPPPENWRLFRNNEDLTAAGLRVKASTLIFALEKRDQLNSLIHQVYSLRSQRGNGLKIIVKLQTPNVRANDKNALLSCGANLILDHTVTPEKLFAEAAAIQGEIFSRFIPNDVNELLKAINPLPLRGYVDGELFIRSVTDLINNVMLTEDNKGVLLACTPVQGLNAGQALTLCSLRRDGDLITIFNNKLVLFLSNCKINELNSTLGFIFKLPVEQIFSQHQSWHLDRDILAKMYQMYERLSANPNLSPAKKALNPAQPGQTKSLSREKNAARIPEEITLTAGPN